MKLMQVKPSRVATMKPLEQQALRYTTLQTPTVSTAEAMHSSRTGVAVPLLASCAVMASGRTAKRTRLGRAANLSSVRRAASLKDPPSNLFKEEARSLEIAGPETAFEKSSGPVAYIIFTRSQPEDADSKLATLDLPENCDVDLAALGDLEAFIASTKFKGGAGSAEVAKPVSGPAERVVLVGLGLAKEEPDWQAAGAAAAGAVENMKGGVAKVLFTDGSSLEAFAKGMLPRLHVDMRLKGSKTKDEDREAVGPAGITFLAGNSDLMPSSEDFDKQMLSAKAVSSGVSFARELVNTTANYLTPEAMATAAEDLASKFGGGKMTAKILDKKECEEMGMGLYLGVAAATNLPPKFIHLTYKPEGEVKRKIGIVGKGLTFDSGGYNMKVGAGSMITEMKFDMGGAAATLGTAAAIAQLQPDGVEVHFIIASCENMVSGNIDVLHPGDIITGMDGTTVEVNNTDAEGRLTLADAMLYCQDQGVEEIVDIATLTGACMVALGKEIAGMWSNNDEFADRVAASAKATGEKVWRMPLEDSYVDQLKSELADTLNTGGRWGGSITAALFLKKFVKNDLPWVHLDIAGTASADKAKGLFRSGGTGSMVRTLTNLVLSAPAKK